MPYSLLSSIVSEHGDFWIFYDPQQVRQVAFQTSEQWQKARFTFEVVVFELHELLEPIANGLFAIVVDYHEAVWAM